MPELRYCLTLSGVEEWGAVFKGTQKLPVGVLRTSGQAPWSPLWQDP